MTASRDEDLAPRPVPEQPAGEPGRPAVSALLTHLEGLEGQPLAVQVERLEVVRKGLDDALARPASGPG